MKEEIENAIINGSLAEEKAIPSIRTLSQQYRLNPQTISNAFNELMNEGLLFKKRGIGMFVERDAQEKLRLQKIKEFREVELKKTIRKGKTLGVKKAEVHIAVDKFYSDGGGK
ncbi:MAG: GntR family transcriptional regulator [Candidatus Cloacimonetes bacterium]|nr:GntR family transcriptional regulator [Candidatus Cloacimonadota bacterium]